MASALQEQNDVIAAADGTNRINTEGVKAQTTGDNTTAEFEDMTVTMSYDGPKTYLIFENETTGEITEMNVTSGDNTTSVEIVRIDPALGPVEEIEIYADFDSGTWVESFFDITTNIKTEISIYQVSDADWRYEMEVYDGNLGIVTDWATMYYYRDPLYEPQTDIAYGIINLETPALDPITMTRDLEQTMHTQIIFGDAGYDTYVNPSAPFMEQVNNTVKRISDPNKPQVDLNRPFTFINISNPLAPGENGTWKHDTVEYIITGALDSDTNPDGHIVYTATYGYHEYSGAPLVSDSITYYSEDPVKRVLSYYFFDRWGQQILEDWYLGEITSGTIGYLDLYGLTFSFYVTPGVIYILYESYLEIAIYWDKIVIDYAFLFVIVIYLITWEIYITIYEITIIIFVYVVNIYIDVLIVIEYHIWKIEIYYYQIILVFWHITIKIIQVTINVWVWVFIFVIRKIVIEIKINIMLIFPVVIWKIILHIHPIIIIQLPIVWIPGLNVDIAEEAFDTNTEEFNYTYMVRDAYGNDIPYALVQVEYQGIVYNATNLGSGLYQSPNFLLSNDLDETIKVTATAAFYFPGELVYDLRSHWEDQTTTTTTTVTTTVTTSPSVTPSPSPGFELILAVLGILLLPIIGKQMYARKKKKK